jgi:uncharacterized protein YcbX
VAIWRYPVKSMLGEELNASQVTARGLLGDRALGLIDFETGKVVGAKNPRRWPRMFEFRAAYVVPLSDSRALPPVRVTLPDGSVLTTDQTDANDRLSAALDRAVRLASPDSGQALAEGYAPDEDFLEQRDQVFEFELPHGTFFDLAVVLLLTTATLDRLRTSVPEGRFEARRFRPNLVIETPDGTDGFVEQDWTGKSLTVGDEVVLRITGPCPRCVMTTLAQGDLPKDPRILRAAARLSGGNVGAYASVARPGRIRRGDVVTLG